MFTFKSNLQKPISCNFGCNVIFARFSTSSMNKFKQKIAARESGILLYGITPPKAGTEDEKLEQIAEKTIERISGLPIDGLIVYDVQDEKERTNEDRPFPYITAMDPLTYVSEHLTTLNVAKIVYRPVGIHSEESLLNWMGQLHFGGHTPVLVGMPSPDFVPKTSLDQAYELSKSHFGNDWPFGAVMIPERHFSLGGEDERILQKENKGVAFFVSQCVFHVENCITLINELSEAARNQDRRPPYMIFTLTTCGSLKTLGFMEWLGIFIPEDIKEEFLISQNLLQTSFNVVIRIAEALILACKKQGIPFGFNIESVAIRKDEIEASIELTNEVKRLLEKHEIIVPAYEM